MFIKICGITTEDDALLAVAMGADAVGFIFAPSERQVAPQNVYDITRRLPPETMTVGVFRNDLPDRVLSVADRAGVKAVQLHGSETPDQVAEIVERGPGHGIRWVIKAFGADSPHLSRADKFHTDVVLVDAPCGCSRHHKSRGAISRGAQRSGRPRGARRAHPRGAA